MLCRILGTRCARERFSQAGNEFVAPAKRVLDLVLDNLQLIGVRLTQRAYLGLGLVSRAAQLKAKRG